MNKRNDKIPPGRQSLDPYVADKTAWLLSAMVGNMPSYFSEQQARANI